MRASVRSTTRVAIALAAALLSTAACGSNGDPARDDGDGERAGEANHATDTRIVEHELGRTEVPAEPRRVVALDPYYSLPTALAAGANVVGASHQPFGEPFPSYIDRSAAADVRDVGWFTELDAERILRLEPDVIIGLESFVGEEYEQLSRIAPTVALSMDAQRWKENLGTIGEAIGRPAAVDQQLADYSDRVETLSQKLDGAGWNTEPVSLLNIRAADDIRVYTRSCAAEVLTDLGLRMHLEERTEQGQNSVDLSLERITDADADVLFYFVGSAGTNPRSAKAAYAEITEHPLWNGLRAVRSERAHQVNAEWWFNCGSTQAADLILDDVADTLGG